jgi:multiple sugar transport system permease protein
MNATLLRRSRKLLLSVPGSTVLLLILAVELLPIFWLIVTSFSLTRDIIAYPPRLFVNPTVKNYLELFRLGVLKGIKNSLIVAVSTIVFTFILGSPFSYLIALYPFKRRDSLRFWVLSLRFMPPIAVIIPFIFLWFKVGMLDTYFSLIVTYLTFSLPLYIWLSIESYKVVPQEVEEAAVLEGCSRFRVFFRISLPLSVQGLLSVLIFTFIFIWNEFFFAFALTSKIQTLPLMVASRALAVYTAPWGIVAAFTVILSIPTLALVTFMFKYMGRLFLISD